MPRVNGPTTEIKIPPGLDAYADRKFPYMRRNTESGLFKSEGQHASIIVMLDGTTLQIRQMNIASTTVHFFWCVDCVDAGCSHVQMMIKTGRDASHIHLPAFLDTPFVVPIAPSIHKDSHALVIINSESPNEKIPGLKRVTLDSDVNELGLLYPGEGLKVIRLMIFQEIKLAILQSSISKNTNSYGTRLCTSSAHSRQERNVLQAIHDDKDKSLLYAEMWQLMRKGVCTACSNYEDNDLVTTDPYGIATGKGFTGARWQKKGN